MSKLKIITKKFEVKRLISHCIKTGYCSFDFETSSTKYYDEDEYPTILSVSFQPGSSWIIPLGHESSPFKNQFVKILQLFGSKVLENPKITKIAWNLSFESNWCRRYKIFLKGRLFDAMLAKYLLDETKPNDLKSMVNRFIPKYANYDAEIGKLVTKHGWAKVPIDKLSKYAGIDSDMELRLYLKFEPLLIKHGLYPLFRNLLMQANQVLSEASYHGICIDVPRLYSTRDIYAQKIRDAEAELRNNSSFLKYESYVIKTRKKEYIKKLTDEIEQLREEGKDRMIKSREVKVKRFLEGNYGNKEERKVVEPFNFGSPKQLADLLFLNKKGFRFKVVKYTEDKYKNETDNPSTAEDVLVALSQKYKEPFITKFVELRGLEHIMSNFLESYIQKEYRGKLHPSFLLHGTVTGRLSSKDPNGQQIPRITTNPHIKPLFIPLPGKVIVQMDYSQAELRVMASMAGETTMMKWFAEGRDIHLATACKKYNFDYDKALKILDDENHSDFTTWTKRRKQAKTINFGIIYGQGANKLSESLSTPEHPISKEEAQTFLDAFFKDFPKIQKFIKSQQAKAKRDKFVVSPFGRKRRLPEIDSLNWGVKAEAQRQSINAPIQGCASDYTQLAGILIKERVRTGEIPIEAGLEFLLTVHDSWIFEMNPEYVHQVIGIMRPICENPETKKWFGFELKGITMKVDFEVGPNWGELRKYDKNFDYTQLIAA